MTGVGEEAFCTGADVTSVVQGGGLDRNDTPDEATGFLEMTALQNQCRKPVTAAVNGTVCGGCVAVCIDADADRIAELLFHA